MCWRTYSEIRSPSGLRDRVTAVPADHANRLIALGYVRADRVSEQ